MEYHHYEITPRGAGFRLRCFSGDEEFVGGVFDTHEEAMLEGVDWLESRPALDSPHPG